MEYSRTVAGQLQLDDYVELAHQIYAKNDTYRSIWDVWAHTLHHAAGVAEAIRKSAPPAKLAEEIADCTLWLLTAIHKLSGTIAEPKPPDLEPPETLVRFPSSGSDLLWHRYPAVCHSCYLRRTGGDRNKESTNTFLPCDCSAHPDTVSYPKELKRRALVALRSLSEERRDQKPKTINQWQEMFGRVFSSNIDRMSLTDLALHLMEELGEVSDAMIRMYSYHKKDFLAGEPTARQLRLESQLADAFSQLFAIVEKISRLAATGCEFLRILSKGGLPASEPITLSAILWKRYGCDDVKSFWCPFCKSISCKCELVFVPANRSVEELLRILEH